MSKNLWLRLLGLFIFYFGSIYISWDSYKYYKSSINCGVVTKIIEVSDYKTQPSIIVNNAGKKIEIIQYYRFEYDFKTIEVGDKIYKEASNQNFIRIKKSGEIDLVKSRVWNDIVAWLYWTPNKTIDTVKIKQSCKCCTN